MGRLRHVLLISAVAGVLAIAPVKHGNALFAQAPPAPAPSLVDGQFRAGLLRRHPNYNNFSLSDIPTLHVEEVRGLIGYIASKVNGYESLIPQSIAREFGADATATFMQALAFDAVRRGEPALYARALLSGGLAQSTRDPNGVVNSDVTVNLPLSSATGQTTVSTTAPEAFNFAVASTAIAAANDRYNAETISMITGRPSTYQPNIEAGVRVPPEAVRAIVAANPGLPRSVANENYSLRVRDEIAFLAGYASQAGASRNIAPINVPLAQEDFCSAPGIRNDIFRASAPDVDIGTAFHAGAAMRRYDTMSDAEFARIRGACPN